MAFSSIGDDIHHLRLTAEASLAQQQITNALLTTILDNTATFKNALAAIDADLKKLIEALSEPPVEKIVTDFQPPVTRP